MTETAEIVAVLRPVLADTPGAGTFAVLPPGRPVPPDADIPASVAELLAVTDGPRVGVIVLFDGTLLPEMTFHLDRFGADAGHWFCFGHINESALFLNRDTGAVWWFPGGHEEWYESDFVQLAHTLDEFVVDYLFGARYAEVTSTDGDRWYSFLRAHRITERETP